MAGIVSKIVEAQNFLRQKYGEEGYKKLVNAILKKTKDNRVLIYIAMDRSLSAVVRLVAMAAIGENG
ncbi:hypothetical protein DRJ17_05760 [Candidatus Woesearchaeota archaeon]|nr:MAG: hypothetical protein DRJ17_05760 [Candidatus Woesearchaeota archaeon]